MFLHCIWRIVHKFDYVEWNERSKSLAKKESSEDQTGDESRSIEIEYIFAERAFLRFFSQHEKLLNNKKGRKMNRGKILHASFHFESRSSMALNTPSAYRRYVLMERSLTLGKRIKGRKAGGEAEEETHEREVLPIKLSSTRKPRARHHKSSRLRRVCPATKRQRVTLRQPITSNRVRRPAPRSMMHA